MTEHLGLVHAVLGRIDPWPLERDDAFQEGCIGLLQAAERFDGRGAFSTFAMPRIRGAIIDARRCITGRKAQRIFPLSIEAGEIDAIDHRELPLEELLDAEAVLDHLPCRSRAILLAQVKGETVGAIAKDYGLSKSRIEQVLRLTRKTLAT